MILQNFYYDCKTCGIRYNALQIPDMLYGNLIMRTNTGKIRYVSAVNSRECKEVGNMVDINHQTARLSENDRADVFQNIFSVACDSAPDGIVYNIRQRPICPQCRQVNIGGYGTVSPPEYVVENIEHVTHEKWNSLEKEEKEKLVDEAISAYLPLYRVEKEKLKEKLRAHMALYPGSKRRWWNR